MAEQVMDMVDMMQTPRGQQDLTDFNWGGEDLSGCPSRDQAGRDSSAGGGVCGLLKGVFGAGLEAQAGSDVGAGASGAAAPEASTSPMGSDSRMSGVEGCAHAHGASAPQQAPRPPTARSQKEGMPSVQRSQSPDMKHMGLRHSIQATKLVLAQSRCSTLRQSLPNVHEAAQDMMSQSRALRSTHVSVSGAKRKAASVGGATGVHEGGGGGITGACPSVSRSVRSSTGKGLSGAAGSARSSGTGGSDGLTGMCGAQAEGGSARSSRRQSAEHTSPEKSELQGVLLGGSVVAARHLRSTCALLLRVHSFKLRLA